MAAVVVFATPGPLSRGLPRFGERWRLDADGGEHLAGDALEG